MRRPFHKRNNLRFLAIVAALTALACLIIFRIRVIGSCLPPLSCLPSQASPSPFCSSSLLHGLQPFEAFLGDNALSQTLFTLSPTACF